MKTSLTLAFSLSLASLVGCAAGTPSAGGQHVPNDGTLWVYAEGNHAVSLRMQPNGSYFAEELTLTSGSSAQVTEEVGTYVITAAGQATLTPQMNTCGGGSDPAYVITYSEAADGSALDVSVGTTVYGGMKPDTDSPYGAFQLTTGCFATAGFVPGSLTAVASN